VLEVVRRDPETSSATADGRQGAVTLLERIGDWAAGLRLEDIPPRVVERLRLQVATSLSAAAWTPWHAPSRRVLEARRGPGSGLVFATGERIAPADAAFVNAAFAMALDFDDYMLCGHTGYSAVLAPLPFAEDLDALLVAAAAANEVMGRLSTACLLGPLNGQMSSYIHNAGAALAVGRILGLDATALAHAVALALYQPSYCLTPGFWEPGAKTLTAAIPMEQGIRAAQVAAAGLTGPLDLLEHPLGFLATFSFGYFPGLFDGLGRVWFSDTLCFKRFPGTSYISAAVEAALGCREALGDRPIERALVETTALSSTLDSLGAAAIDRSPLDANAVNFSVKLSVAAALRFGDLLPEHLRPEHLIPEEGRIRDLAKRVEVVHDWAQTLRMFGESPLGPRMVAGLGPRGWARLVSHGRRMNSASGRGNRGRLGGAWRALAGPLRAALRPGPLSDRAFDARSFRLLQAARVTLFAGGARHTRVVLVPVGAGGRDPAETRALVRWRCEQAFGGAAEALWDRLHRPGVALEELRQLAAPR